MTIACAGRAFAAMSGIELLVFGVGDQVTGHVKSAERHLGERPLVRTGIGRFAAHDELARWNEEHLAPERVHEVRKALTVRVRVQHYGGLGGWGGAALCRLPYRFLYKCSSGAG